MKERLSTFPKKLISGYRFAKLKLRSFSFALKVNILGGQCSYNIKLHGPIILLGDYRNLRIGDNVSLNHDVLLNCSAQIFIESNVTISARCQLQTPYLDLTNRHIHRSKPIHLEQGCWIAAGTIIAAGSVIRQNTVVSALSFVKGELEHSSLYAGNPAIKIKNLPA